MHQCLRPFRHLGLVVLVLAFFVGKSPAQDTPEIKGLRVFYTGHSFHYFVPPILTDIAKKAGVKDHVEVGLSAIGGSRTIQHWNVPDEKNKAKEALKAGKVDVLTLAPIFLPDDGIEKFATLAFENNPKVRVTVQELWLPYEEYDKANPLKNRKVDHNALTVEDLRKRHANYFKDMDDQVIELNKKLGKQVLYVVPVGQAVIALREKIIEGKAPGLKTQNDLFTDAIGHAKAPLQVLVAYCHFASIYQRSPVGLPAPAALGKASPELNRLLQELAWEAVSQHPLSGVKAEVKR